MEDIECVTNIITNIFEANNRIVRGEQEKVHGCSDGMEKCIITFFKEMWLWLNMSTESLSVMIENVQVHFYFCQKGRFMYEGVGMIRI